jgi:hypothetical protein
MSLSTSDFLELEENSIYFTNEFSEMHGFYILLGEVYNMETKVFKSYYKFRGNCGKMYPPVHHSFGLFLIHGEVSKAAN